MRGKHTIVCTAVVLAASASGLAPALASPQGAPSSSSVAAFDCGPDGTFTGFTNSGSSGALTWNPFFLTAPDGSSVELDPTANDLVVTVNGAVVFAPDATKGNAAGAVTCAVSGGSGAVVVAGSVTGNLVRTSAS